MSLLNVGCFRALCCVFSLGAGNEELLPPQEVTTGPAVSLLRHTQPHGRSWPQECHQYVAMSSLEV